MTDEEIRRLRAEHFERPASEYHQAGRFHGFPDVPEDDPDKAHALIVDAFKRPVTLPDGVFSFDKSPPEFRGRGRPAKKSPYDNFIQQLRGAFHKQARLPYLRKGATRPKVHEATALRLGVQRAAEYLLATGSRATTKAVASRLDELRRKGRYAGRTDEKVVGLALKGLRDEGFIPKRYR